MNLPQNARQAIIVAGLLLTASQPTAAQENARLTADAFLYLSPDASRPPFAKIESGSLVTILRSDQIWVNVRIVDADQKERQGYVETRYVRPWAPAKVNAPSTKPETRASAGQVESIRSIRNEAPTSTRADADAIPPRPAPAANTAPIRLSDIRRLFIEKMPDDLDQYISTEITKQFKGRVVVVLNKESADAIMRGTSENRTGTGAAITGRYLGLHDNASGSISLVDRAETAVLWASEAGDRSLLFGVMKRGGQRKVADRLVNNLKKALSTTD